MEIETLLLDMRQEARIEHAELKTGISEVHTRVDDVLKAFQAHEVKDEQRFGEVHLKLQPLQNIHRAISWVIGTLGAAMIFAIVAIVFDLIKNHLK